MNNKKIYLIIGGLSLIILVLGITYAWFEWQSNTNTNVTFEVGDLGITYIGDENVLSKVLYPTASMTNPDNVIHTFSLTTSSNIDIYSKISLEIVSIDEELKDESFVWKLYRNDTYIAGGNFLNAIQGSDVLLIQNEKITNELTNYTLYIWIDGVNYNNPLDMGGKSFNFKLKFEAGQQAVLTDECFTFDESTGTITDYLCSVITDVVIPGEINGVTVTAIGVEAFKENNLTSIKIPNSVTTIGKGAFAYNSITNVVIPDSVETIGDYAFSSNNLTSVVIPSSVTTVGEGAFYKNSTLASIKVDDDNTVYDSRDNSNAIIKTSSNTLIQGCKTTVIPKNVTSINTAAFLGMGLTEIEIPGSIKTIGNFAFDINNLTSVIIPDSVETIGQFAFRNNNINSLTLGNGLTTIGKYAFMSNNLTSIYIPSNVVSLAYNPFSDNPTLESIVVDKNNTVYDSGDNSNFIIKKSDNLLISGLKDTVIPNTVVTIWSSAFNGMGLTKIEIPNSVEKIGYASFSDNNLTEITIPDSVIEISDFAFQDNNISSITMGNNVKKIGLAAFQNDNLTSVVIPDSVTSIDGYAFYNNNLTSVTLGNSVEKIGTASFYGNNLTSVVIPSSVTSIGSYAFSWNNLTEVTISSSVTSIGQYAFASDSQSSPNLTTIYNLTGRSFNWNYIINGSSSTTFITGTVTTSDNRIVTITTLE